MITKITDVYTRLYSDSGQITTYVEWEDHKGRCGRTEGSADNLHMSALITRGQREGVDHRRETW
jgi:hypothetical protein